MAVLAKAIPRGCAQRLQAWPASRAPLAVRTIGFGALYGVGLSGFVWGFSFFMWGFTFVYFGFFLLWCLLVLPC